MYLYTSSMHTAQRGCGIFAPISCLPSPYGSGAFGEEAFRFIDFLVANGVSYWQVLPFTYSHHGINPYAGQSSLAKDHLLLDPGALVLDGLLTEAQAKPPRDAQAARVKPSILPWKHELCALAYQSYVHGKAKHLTRDFEAYIVRESDWVIDFALYTALSEKISHSWWDWPKALREREPAALIKAELKYDYRVRQEIFAQFLLDRQWRQIRKYAKEQRITIIGDVPIYSTTDSCDVWMNLPYFAVTPRGRLAKQSGAPPDTLSKRGQAWGSPVYNWKAIIADNYRWPLKRFQAQFRDVDLVRIDHFLGYIRYWAIPDGKAVKSGHWEPAPGDAFLDVLKANIPSRHFIVEDLGTRTKESARVLKRFGAMGMHVLCMEMRYRKPEKAMHYPEDVVAYTSTHDTNTLLGWYRGLTATKHALLEKWWEEQHLNGLPLHFRFIKPLLESQARLAILPLQDVFGLGAAHRCNTPGTVNAKNWSWRFQWSDLREEDLTMLRSLLIASDRA